MDGNSRWAKKNGKTQIVGYIAGINAIKRIVNFAICHGIKVLTLYAFSSENWHRPKKEVSSLMRLFLTTLSKELHNFKKYKIKFKIIGNINDFSIDLQKKIKYAEMVTEKNNSLILNIAANYGGKWDIINCIKKIVKRILSGKLNLNMIDEKVISDNLCMSDLPSVDLLIRTGGEFRISNFLLWQIAYTELYFTKIFWPDFDENALVIALKDFSKRQRRYGKRINNFNDFTKDM